jgi:hypothetical protein
MADCQRPTKVQMLILPDAVYQNESHVIQIFADAHLLRFWRMGVVTSRDGNIGTTDADPYRLIVAYAAGKRRGPFHSIHRIAYLNVGGAPDHFVGIDDDTSDNLLVPTSFVAKQAWTTEPTEFGLSASGHTPATHRWQKLIAERKRSADLHSHKYGIAPLNSSVERWGQTYGDFDL